MAKPIRVDFSNTEDNGGFYIEPGTYTVKCTKVTQEEGDKAPYLKFTFNVEGHGVALYNNCTLKPDALFSLKNTLHALLGKEIPKSAMSIDPEILVGRFCKAAVADREYNGKTYSNITRLSPMPVTPPVGSSKGAVDDLMLL